MSGIHQKPRGNFVENTVSGLCLAMERVVYADDVAARGGLLQRLDPRVKLCGTLSLIVAVTLSAKLWVIVAVLVVAVVLAAVSRVQVWKAMSPVWISALIFTGVIAIPALFLTPGVSVLHLRRVDLDITAQGLRTAEYLLLRVETCTTLAMLLAFTTPWARILKALRVLGVPVVFVVVLGMTFRYILLLLETARQMFESRKSRTVGKLGGGDYRRLAIAGAGVLLGRTFQLSNDVYLAMQSRGFRGEVYVLEELQMTGGDWAALAIAAGLAVAAGWAGH